MASPLLSRVKENEWGRLVGTAVFSFIGRATGETSSVLGRRWTSPTSLLLPCPREVVLETGTLQLSWGSEAIQGMGSLSELGGG